MTQYIAECGLQLLLPVLAIVILMKNHTSKNYFRIALFASVYLIYQLLLVIPRFYEILRFVPSHQWNWSGKILAIAWGISCYILLRKPLKENDFFTFRQDKKSNKLTWFVSFMVIISISVLFYFIDSSPFDWETLAFQLTMPGLDEEIIFRGILLGLLLSVLPDKIPFLGNPSILLTAVLFGLMHGLTLTKNFGIEFDWISFLHTGVGGWVFGWLAYKSKSIVKPIITHSGTNFLAALATMI